MPMHLCVDLKRSYQSGQLAVTDSFDGSDSLRRMAFRSKSHKLIVPTKERRNNDGSWVLGLMSLRPLKVLRTCSSDLLFHKVDSTHFAEEDRTNRTLSVFSTDDFETPVCIFALDGKFKCGNGFIALVHPDEGCVDLVDAVTGTWLLRQPFLPHTHMESNREPMSDHNRPHAVRGTLATPPEHVLWARDQLMPLLACVAVPRCGARSPASLVPHGVLAYDVGKALVMRAIRRVVVCGYRLINTAAAGGGANFMTAMDHTGFHLVFVGVSITLGVVELWGWGQIANPFEVGGWLGNNYGALPIEKNTHILVVDPLEMTVVEEEVLGFEHCKYLQIRKGRKWAVLFTKFEAEKIAIRPLGLKGGVCRTMDVTGQIMEVDMIDDDEVALSTTARDYSFDGHHLLCADLEKSYNSGQLVVTHSFPGGGSLLFRSKKRNLVAQTYVVPEKIRDAAGGVQLVLRSLCTLKRLDYPTWSFKKVDYTHFAEEDKTNHTVNVFSTGDDFGRPVRTFALNGRFQCGNGIIALTQQEEGSFEEEKCYDFVDAVTGTWLLRCRLPCVLYMEAS
ncbi:hypothetical protein Pelo_14905 [Pelomyxa schiedti]|nr:hypothetical protein Pelo_14905 [Pelomyxa schiedti]